MSAWTVYWVLQLDSIKTAFFLLSGVFLVPAIVIGCFTLDEHDGPLFKRSVREGAIGLAIAISCMFIPNSKTAAAMIVLPALTSEEVVGTVKSEAKELYEMAKEALKEKITTVEEKKVEG